MSFIINILHDYDFSLLFSPVFPCTTPFEPDPPYRGFPPKLVVNEERDLYQNEVGQVGPTNGKLETGARFKG